MKLKHGFMTRKEVGRILSEDIAKRRSRWPGPGTYNKEYPRARRTVPQKEGFVLMLRIGGRNPEWLRSTVQYDDVIGWHYSEVSKDLSLSEITGWLTIEEYNTDNQQGA